MGISIADTTEEQCCGCGSCAGVCPAGSIVMKENERGFLMPGVDPDTCIHCGLCVRSCPERIGLHRHAVQSAWAAAAREKEEQMQSTSGGVFGLLAEQILGEGGAVFGCAWDGVKSVRHVPVENVRELPRIRGSKYIQSSTEEAYVQARHKLEEGRIVLFSGTGCQIAGLYAFLGGSHPRLYTAETACHGVPSPGMFRQYADWREKKAGSAMVRYRFRHRDLHLTGEHYKACGEYADGNKEYYPVRKDPYYGAFLTGRNLRAVCYHCRYKGRERTGDLTLCDFWGIEKELRRFPARYGASAVLVNTYRGRQLLESIRSRLILKECSPESVFRHNPGLTASASCSPRLRTGCLRETDPEAWQAEFREQTGTKERIRETVKTLIPDRMKYYLKRIRR